MAQIDLKDVVVTIQDKDGTNSVEIKFGEGNLTWTERKPRKYTLNRGKLSGMGVRNDDEQLVDVKLDGMFEYYTGTTTEVTPSDAIKGEGGAAAWTSTDDDGCNPYAVDIIAHHNPDCLSGDSQEFVFNDFRWEELAFDVKAGSIGITGKAVSVTGTRLGVSTNS